MRVLLVEDEGRVAGFIAHGLREQAYAVDIAGDGEQALYQAAVNDYDLIILDVMLPRKDGYAVCREARAGGYRGPILMLTARDAVDDRVAGLDSGADDYLAKPFDFKELLARLRALAAAPGGAAPAGDPRGRPGPRYRQPRVDARRQARQPDRQGIRAAGISGAQREPRGGPRADRASTSGTRASTRFPT